MRFFINGEEYQIHFQHIRHLPPGSPGFEPRREPLLRAHPSLAGITLAVIASPRLIAQGVALCAAGDSYRKETGRIKALHRAIAGCAPLKEIAPEIMKAYFERRVVRAAPRRPA